MERTNQSTQPFFRGVLFLGFALLLTKLMITGDILNFIAPRMLPYMYFALILFYVLGLVFFFFSNELEEEHDHACGCGHDHSLPTSIYKKLFLYSLFLVPLLSGFLFPDKTLDSQIVANRSIQYGSGLFTEPPKPEVQAVVNEEESGESEEDELSASNEVIDSPNEEISSSESGREEDLQEIEDLTTEWHKELESIKKEMLASDLIVFTDENYLKYLGIIDQNKAEFVGKKIQILGFAYREPDFSDNQLVVARFAVACCVADASVYGFLAKGELSGIENDQWLTVTGTLELTAYNGFEIPIIQVDQVEFVKAPDNPYVYNQ